MESLRDHYFLLSMYDLPLNNNTISDAILIADNTSVIITQDDYDYVKQTSNLVLSPV